MAKHLPVEIAYGFPEDVAHFSSRRRIENPEALSITIGMLGRLRLWKLAKSS